jgi:Mrp family chromosome partitioning ATPase/uncharacterized protein involved in exopolysaccharide biosynthesis
METQAEQDQMEFDTLTHELPRRSGWRVIWERRGIALLVLLLCLAAGVAYCLLAPPIYTGTAKIYVEQVGPKILSEHEGVMTQSKDYLYTQAELLASTPVLAAALKRPGISDLAVFDDVDNEITLLRDELNVEVSKKGDILRVAFPAADPVEAAQVTNAVVDAYLEFASQEKRTSAGEVLKILRADAELRRAELQRDEKAFIEFKKAHPEISLEHGRGNVTLQRLSRLSDALSAAQIEVLDAKADFESIQALMDKPAQIRQFVEAKRKQGGYGSVDREWDELRAEHQDQLFRLGTLRQESTEDHPAVKMVRERIRWIEARLAALESDFASAHLAVVRQAYMAAKQKETGIAEALDVQEARARELAQDLGQYMLLESAYERSRNLAELIDNRISELNVTEDTGALNINVFEYAEPADKPTHPQIARVMALALVLGLLLGTGLAYVAHWVDQRIHSSDQVSAVLGLPVLSSIPRIGGKDTSLRTCGLISRDDPESPVAEAFRSVRTAVYFGLPRESAGTILVTSPEAEDGKSILVSNLGIAMARAGQKVLVVDADFRRPAQHKIFKVKRKQRTYDLLREHFNNIARRFEDLPEDKAQPDFIDVVRSDDFDEMLRKLNGGPAEGGEPADGLSSALSGRRKLDACIATTSVPDLDVLPCGPIPANPSELLNSTAMAEALETLRGRYDHVIIDSPPVLAVTDSRILGALSDITVLVVRAEKTDLRHARQAVASLAGVGARLFGLVVNAVPRRKGRNYSYDGYLYGSGYGAQSNASSPDAHPNGRQSDDSFPAEGG